MERIYAELQDYQIVMKDNIINEENYYVINVFGTCHYHIQLSKTTRRDARK